MTDTPKMTFNIGSIISADLTIPNADEVRDFYKQVVGWESEEMKVSDESGEYSDYVMKDQAGNWVGGVCHARGINLGIPPQWLVHVNVADIQASADRAIALGGKIIKKSTGDDGTLYYIIIQDPAGAMLSLTKAG
jgi:uncharacterized protein